MNAVLAIALVTTASGGTPPASTSKASMGSTTTTSHSDGVTGVLARLDSLHERRDDDAALAEAHRLVEIVLRAEPNDHGVLWRAARVRFTESDRPSVSTSERSRHRAPTGEYRVTRTCRSNPSPATKISANSSRSFCVTRPDGNTRQFLPPTVTVRVGI